jgi:hypothetical protein
MVNVSSQWTGIVHCAIDEFDIFMVLSLELMDTDLVVRAKKSNYYKLPANLHEFQPFNFLIVTYSIIALQLQLFLLYLHTNNLIGGDGI